MKKLLSFVLVGMMASSVSISFAATGTTSDTDISPTPTDMTFSAAPTSTSSGVVAAPGSSLGEYKLVSCDSNSSFAINSCDQCFDGGSIKVGTRLTGLFDNWTNTSANFLVAYKEEQKAPNMVRFGNTVWKSAPIDETKVFKNGPDVQWTNSGTGKLSYMLNPSQKAKFYDADLTAGYTLEKTDKKAGELIGMLRFPVVSHTVDIKTAAEGSASTHYECVAYKLDSPAVVAPTTPTPTTPVKPVPPKEVTQTQTGPETLLLIAAAFFIAFGMMFALRQRV